MFQKGIKLLLCCFMIVICMGALCAGADAATTHSHLECGETSCSHSVHKSNKTFIAWDGKSSVSGTYLYLTQDVERSSFYGFSGTVCLCLNGHTISCENMTVGLTVNSGAYLYICDCKGTGMISAQETGIDNHGSFTLFSGTIHGEANNGIYTFEDGRSVSIYGGTVSGGIYTEASNHSVNVFGGNIQSGITGSGSLRMTGGTVTSEYHEKYGMNSIDIKGDVEYSGGTVGGITTYGSVYLSSNSSPGKITLGKNGTIYAHDKSGSSYYSGGAITISMYDSGIAVHDVPNASTAALFQLTSEDEYGFLKYDGTNIVYSKPTDYGSCGANTKWSYFSDGTLVISGSGSMYDYRYSDLHSTAPWISSYQTKIKRVEVGENVTSIGAYAFYNCSNLKEVDFGRANLTLGNWSFSCPELTSINFGTGTIVPAERVFADCDALESVHVPANVRMNGNYNGAGSGYDLFYSCGSLKTVTVDCTYIGPFMFESCYALQSVTFTDPNVKFYYVEHTSGHPFNVSKATTQTIRVIGYACSDVQTLVEKTTVNYINIAFEAIAGDTTHSGLKHHTASPAGCTTNGNVEYWQCEKCLRYYLDEAGEQKTASVTIPAAHKYDAEGVCSVCQTLNALAMARADYAYCREAYLGEAAIDQAKLYHAEKIEAITGSSVELYLTGTEEFTTLPAGQEYQGIDLILFDDNTVTLQVVFIGAGAFSDGSGRTLTPVADNSNKDYTILALAERVPVEDLAETVTLKVDGSATMTVSPLSYAAKAIASEEDAQLKTLMQALVVYYQVYLASTKQA